MNKLNVNGKEYDVVSERNYGENINNQRKEILIRDPSNNISYLLMSCMAHSASAVSATILLTEKNTISELTEEQVDSWEKGSFNVETEKLVIVEVVKEIIVS